MMKQFLFTTLLFLTCFNSHSQTKNIPTFNEVFISMNATVLNQVFQPSRTKIGFGIGSRLGVQFREKYAFVIGLEFNYTRQGISEQRPYGKMVFGYIGYKEINQFDIGTISLAITHQISLGEKRRFSIEPGVYVESNVISRIEGFNITPSPVDADSREKFSEKSGYVIPLNAGISLALGWNQEFEKINLVFRPEIKFSPFNISSYSQSGTDSRWTNIYTRLAVGIQF